jgi:hypothetical protein
MLTAQYLELGNLVCPTEDSCVTIIENNMPVFYNKNHVSEDGAIFLGQKLGQVNYPL